MRSSISKLLMMRNSIDLQISPKLKGNSLRDSGNSTPSSPSKLLKRMDQKPGGEISFQRLNSILTGKGKGMSYSNIAEIEKEDLKMQLLKKLIDSKKVEFYDLVKSSIEEELAIETQSADDQDEDGGQDIGENLGDHQEYVKNFEGDTEQVDLLMIEPKNSVELLKMYNDNYPLLLLRKKILYYLKWISLICYKIIKHQIFEYCSLIVIIMNSILLALENPNVEDTDPVRLQMENVFLILYTIEMFLKIFALGFVLNKGAYLRDAWNILDFVIVFTAYLPMVLSNDSGVNLSSLRSLRVLRPLRTISSVKNLKVLLRTLFSALPLLLGRKLFKFDE
jgi:hypothetical protein